MTHKINLPHEEVRQYCATLEDADQRSAFERAKEKLEPEEKVAISTYTKYLTRKLKSKNPNIQMNPDMAMEVLAKLGMFMVAKTK
jgi:hypothetical protein